MTLQQKAVLQQKMCRVLDSSNPCEGPDLLNSSKFASCSVKIGPNLSRCTQEQTSIFQHSKPTKFHIPHMCKNNIYFGFSSSNFFFAQVEKIKGFLALKKTEQAIGTAYFCSAVKGAFVNM